MKKIQEGILMYEWNGQKLCVNLDEGLYHKEKIPEKWLKDFIGGRGLIAGFNKQVQQKSKRPQVGILNPRHFLGRWFKVDSMYIICSSDSLLKSIPFGKYQRIKPLVFSLVPRSHEWYGCAK
jgi:aldehyde:ferredoxin oxidoreductase